MILPIATMSGWVGSRSVCSVPFFTVVAIVLAMLLFAFVCRDRKLPQRCIIAAFPPILVLVDAIWGASWSLLIPRFLNSLVYFTRWRLYGVDLTMGSVVCVSFELLFASEALRGQSRWERVCGRIFVINSVVVILFRATVTMVSYPLR